ncbi:MAG: dihydropteroate synthase [Betaproteobacteria bacterium SG8_41]|nr:MAG: dihydropteroate synthase [Betaproteobacteria bacterium SG8_41]KPK67370.1 MAG: dihydropteroate synthase [Acidithiobacillales bacterium SM23_46]
MPPRGVTRLRVGTHTLDLARPVIMGILNVTPDSFSDGGRFVDLQHALVHAHAMVADGAAIIDVGGESTRPGAQAVSVDEELARVIPVIEALRRELDIPVSIDTGKPEVMRAAVVAGAGFINDVYALRLPGALEAAAALGVPVCLMHMQGEPRTMQESPQYGDVVRDVTNFLGERLDRCVSAGIPRERLLIDPGFGFGKTLEHNLELLRRLDEFAGLGVPLLVGLSRKSMIGKALGLALDDRQHASVALALMAVQRGARIVRVHDVRATHDALRMYEAVWPASES